MRNTFAALLGGLLLVLVLSCAKKMLPPSPDRFPPQLEDVETRTRSQVALVFDEAIDGAKLWPDSFFLIGSAGETLALRGASIGKKSDEVQLWTPIQERKLYQLRGVVRDEAGNPERFRARFMGSTKRDTIAPRVIRVDPGPGTTRQKRAVTVRVSFSKAIDTASLGSESLGHRPWLFVPVQYDTLFKRSWSSDWQALSFTRRESLPAGAVVYFLLQPKAADLEGNRIKASAFTYFASDTLLDVVPVKGKAAWPDSITGPGVVFFTESASVRVFTDSLKVTHTESLPVRTTGLAPLLADGSFSTKLHKGEYEVVAVADTNADGLADFASVVVKFNTDAESLSLTLQPESLPKPINAYRR
ncbi:MAG TPA: Ig-like domain-containing protein [bacterium]|nr:Ig-like domain-containing protein [bacterium]